MGCNISPATCLVRPSVPADASLGNDKAGKTALLLIDVRSRFAFNSAVVRV
jgi:hypothetical protein